MKKWQKLSFNRPVKINGSPVSLTEKLPFSAKQNLKKITDFPKTLMSYRFLCKKPFLVDNLAKVAETLRMKIKIYIVRTFGSCE